MVQGVFVVVRAKHQQVVNVRTDDEPLSSLAVRSFDLLTAVENAWVTVGLLERLVVPLGKPREERSLPAASGLGHAIARFDDLTDSRKAVRTFHIIAGRHRAIDHFSFLQVTLEVGGSEVPPAHAESIFGSDCTEET